MPRLLHSPFAPGFGAIHADELASALKVLADPSRLRILALLHKHGTLYGSDLVPELGLAQPTVVHHLRLLEEAGLIRSEKSGVYVYRSLEPAALIALSNLLHPEGH